MTGFVMFIIAFEDRIIAIEASHIHYMVGIVVERSYDYNIEM